MTHTQRCEITVIISNFFFDPLTKKREVDGLLYAAHETKCKNLMVITWDYESVEEHEGMKVKFIPLWKWLTGDGRQK
jgi:predicted AAA+ superfamily ATPase